MIHPAFLDPAEWVEDDEVPWAEDYTWPEYLDTGGDDDE